MIKNRSLLLFLILVFIIGGVYWTLTTDLFYSIEKYVSNADLLTLETRYTPEEIIEIHKDELIGSSDRTFQEPFIQFYPYLLFQVKYYDKQQKTKQGALIWSLVDGEMVLNTETWEKTRGFSDALLANSTPLEFKVLNALAEAKGLLSREKLQKELNIEQEALSALVDQLKQKNLIVVKNNDVILHIENPKFNVPPQTKIDSPLVIKPYRQGKRISAKFGKSQIKKMAKAAFGEEFTILDSEEIYLPVYRISLLNPDGSLLITDWNALTGHEIKIGLISRY